MSWNIDTKPASDRKTFSEIPIFNSKSTSNTQHVISEATKENKINGFNQGIKSDIGSIIGSFKGFTLGNSGAAGFPSHNATITSSSSSSTTNNGKKLKLDTSGSLGNGTSSNIEFNIGSSSLHTTKGKRIKVVKTEGPVSTGNAAHHATTTNHSAPNAFHYNGNNDMKQSQPIHFNQNIPNLGNFDRRSTVHVASFDPKYNQTNLPDSTFTSNIPVTNTNNADPMKMSTGNNNWVKANAHDFSTAGFNIGANNYIKKTSRGFTNKSNRRSTFIPGSDANYRAAQINSKEIPSFPNLNSSVNSKTLVDELKQTDAHRLASEFKSLANSLYKEKKYQDAADSYSKAIYLVPNNPICYCNRAACYMMIKDYNGALRDSLLCIATDSKYVRGHVRAGRSYLAMGKASAARAQFTEAVSLAQSHESGKFAEDSKRGLVQCDDYEKVLREGESLLASHNYHSALKCAEHALNLAPHSRHASLLMVRIYLFAQENAEAVKLCEKFLPSALEKDASQRVLTPPIWKTEIIGVDCELIIYYAKALLYSGDIYSAEFLLSSVPDGVKQQKSITRQLLRVRRMKTEKISGNDAFRQGHFKVAFERYSAVLECDPYATIYNAVVLCNRAAASMSLGNFDSAYEDCSKAIKNDGTLEKARTRRSRAAVQLGKFESAVLDLNWLHEHDPTNNSFIDELREVKAIAAASKAEAAATRARKITEKEASFRRREKLHSERMRKEREEKARQTLNEEHRQRRQAEEQKRYREQHANPHKSHGYYGSGLPRSNPVPGSFNPPNTNSRSLFSPSNATDDDNHYKLLGIEKNASDKDIKKAFHKRALKYHPDKCKRENAEDTFKRITVAYQILSDAGQRRKYDLDLQTKNRSRQFSSRNNYSYKHNPTRRY